MENTIELPLKLESYGKDRCCVNHCDSVAVVRVICFDGMMSFVVHCSFAEKIMTEHHTAGSQEVSRPSQLIGTLISIVIRFIFFVLYVVYKNNSTLCVTSISVETVFPT